MAPLKAPGNQSNSLHCFPAQAQDSGVRGPARPCALLASGCNGHSTTDYSFGDGTQRPGLWRTQ